MYREKIPHGQMRIWLVAALAAPAAVYGGGISWSGVILATAVGIAAYLLLEKLWEPVAEVPAWFAVLEWLWLGIYAGRVAGVAATFWPEGMNEKAVPLILIAVSCVSAAKGAGCGGKSGAVLFWLIVPAISGVFLAGKNNIKWEWAANTKPDWKPELYTLMLIPAMTVSLLPREKGKKDVIPLIAGGILGLTAVLVINGSLTQDRAAAMENPLYEYSKGVTLLGTVKGLEAVVACALTAGWYVLLSLLTSSAGNGFCGKKSEQYKTAVWGCGIVAAAVVLLDVGNPVAEALISAASWVGIPVIVGLRKKLKKQKNST